MKKRALIILTLVLLLMCASAQAAVDMSAFLPASQSITFDTEDPYNPGTPISVLLTDMNEYVFFNMLMPIDGEPSVDSGWDMYVSEKYPSLIRWQSDAGDIVEINLSAEQPLCDVSYAPAGKDCVYIYNMHSTLVSRISGMTVQTIPFEETEKWISCALTDTGNGSRTFGLWMRDTQALLAQTQPAQQSAAQAVEEQPRLDECIFEPSVVIAENDALKIEVIDFHQEDVNWHTGPATESILSLKFTNKTDHKLIVNPDAYFGADEAYLIMRNGNTVEAGKAAVRSYYVQQYKGSEPTALDSLDQLYQLEGTIEISHSIDNIIRKKEQLGFSFPGVLGTPAQSDSQAAPAAAAQPTAAPAATASTPESTTRVRTVELAQDYDTLKTGSKGESAKKLQQALIDQGFLNSKADGAYGKVTAAAVAEFQKSVGLEATGVADAATQSMLYGDAGEIQLTLTGVSEGSHMRLEGLYVDASWTEKPGISRLYVCYTALAPEKSYSVSPGKSKVIINGQNSYESLHQHAACMYLGSYYYGGYLRDVPYGGEFQVVETFEVPTAELAPGRSISLKNTSIPGSEDLSVLTDDVYYARDSQFLAQVADPEGYARQSHLLAEADSATQNKVRKEVNGYYWTCMVNNITYKIEFKKNTYDIYAFGVKSGGKYVICNGYILLVNESTGHINYLPYLYENGVFKLKAADGMDVTEN